MKKAFLWGAALCAALIFMGCPTDDDKKEKKKEEPFTLTVTGIPFSSLPAGKTIGASLLNPGDRETRVAIGIDMAMSGTFTFYYPAAPGSALPVDLTKPFFETGNYWLALAEADIQTFVYTTVYMYMATADQPATCSFPAQQAIPWGHFQEVPYTP